ncbi:acyl-CoA dehydrogenase, partial [Streptomyces sp. NPDC048279]|uniref:acyl-CoA dehydrogenase n=1 Tax=Streptomyces sp. NPDC048279 TaxID=3154714 RepID=UPI00343EA3FF
EMDKQERQALTYRRLRYINDQLGLDRPLSENRERLFPVLEWSAIADPALFYAMFIHHCETVGAIQILTGGRNDLAPELKSLASAHTIGALLTTELGRGNSNNDIHTEAVYDPDRHEFVVHTPDSNAAKCPPGVASHGFSRLGMVSARVMIRGQDCGVSFFLVPIRDELGLREGVRVTPQPFPAALALDNAIVAFDHVRVPFRYWLRDGVVPFVPEDPSASHTDPTAGGLQMLSIIRCAWEAAAAGLAGVSRASAAIALRHAHRRRTSDSRASGIPVIAYRNQQRALFSSLAAAYVVSFVANSMTTPVQPEMSAKEIRTSYLLKAALTRLAERITMRTRIASGVHGFLDGNRFFDYQIFAHSFRSAGGDNQVLAFQAAHAMSQGLDYTPPSDEPLTRTKDDLSHPGTWTRLAESRESRLHTQLTSALRSAEQRGQSQFDAWNDHLDLAESLAEAHTSSMVLGIVRDALDAVDDARVRAVVVDLCALFALEELQDHAGWYLAEGLLTAGELRDLRFRVNAICERIRPHALELAEGLGVPYHVAGSPLSEDDYVGTVTRSLYVREASAFSLATADLKKANA